MTDQQENVRSVLRRATLERKKGDAKRKQGRAAEAEQDYRRGLEIIEDFLATDADLGAGLEPADGAELFGLRGGLLHRTDQLPEALQSYERGAEFERTADLASTYNRTNAVKLALVRGSRTAEQLQEVVGTAEKALSTRLRQDEEAAEDAWLWADLGDVRLLRGDVEGATEAYTVFARKASTGSPATTLEMLERVAAALEQHEDPAAGEVRAAVDRVRPLLA
jgi:tetratricopeptide (TPR) repeat protein